MVLYDMFTGGDKNKLVRKYNKLVRDRIPEIITRKGDICKCEILSDAKYINMLDKKL